MRIGEWQDEKPTEPGMYLVKMRWDKDSQSFFVRVRALPEWGLHYSPERAAQHILLAGDDCLWRKIHTEEPDELIPGTRDALNKLTIKG